MGFWTRFKSSITGLFVKRSYAVENPGTTYGEKVPAKTKAANVSAGVAKKSLLQARAAKNKKVLKKGKTKR